MVLFLLAISLVHAENVAVSAKVSSASVNADVAIKDMDKDQNQNKSMDGDMDPEKDMPQDKTQIKAMVDNEKVVTASGQEVQIKQTAANKIELKTANAAVETGLQIKQELSSENKTMLKATLSNGKDAEIKVMPDTASQTAVERLQLKVCSEENQCQIELKEVSDGEEIRAAYEVQAQKEAKVLGLFKTQMTVEAQIDAETGEVINSNKPWWAFLASE